MKVDIPDLLARLEAGYTRKTHEPREFKEAMEVIRELLKENAELREKLGK